MIVQLQVEQNQTWEKDLIEKLIDDAMSKKNRNKYFLDQDKTENCKKELTNKYLELKIQRLINNEEVKKILKSNDTMETKVQRILKQIPGMYKRQIMDFLKLMPVFFCKQSSECPFCLTDFEDYDIIMAYHPEQSEFTKLHAIHNSVCYQEYKNKNECPVGRCHEKGAKAMLFISTEQGLRRRIVELQEQFERDFQEIQQNNNQIQQDHNQNAKIQNPNDQQIQQIQQIQKNLETHDLDQYLQTQLQTLKEFIDKSPNTMQPSSQETLKRQQTLMETIDYVLKQTIENHNNRKL